MSYYAINNELYHHGIKGQKWGVRRFQNEDGSRTAAGLKRAKEGYKEYRKAKKFNYKKDETYSNMSKGDQKKIRRAHFRDSMLYGRKQANINSYDKLVKGNTSKAHGVKRQAVSIAKKKAEKEIKKEIGKKVFLGALGLGVAIAAVKVNNMAVDNYVSKMGLNEVPMSGIHKFTTGKRQVETGKAILTQAVRRYMAPGQVGFSPTQAAIGGSKLLLEG